MATTTWTCKGLCPPDDSQTRNDACGFIKSEGPIEEAQLLVGVNHTRGSLLPHHQAAVHNQVLPGYGAPPGRSKEKHRIGHF